MKYTLLAGPGSPAPRKKTANEKYGMGSRNPKWNIKMSLRFKFASQVSYNHLSATFHLEISVAFPQLQWLPMS